MPNICNKMMTGTTVLNNTAGKRYNIDCMPNSDGCETLLKTHEKVK